MVNMTPAPGPVGADHLLHAHRQGDRGVIEALILPVADGPIGEQRGEAALAGGEQLLRAADVEERLLLPGEARPGQVLCGGAAAHGHIDPGRFTRPHQFLIRGHDRAGRAGLNSAPRIMARMLCPTSANAAPECDARSRG